VKNDNEALQTYLDACLAVKEKYTKLESWYNNLCITDPELYLVD
jgi:hypothetical protein